MTVDMQALGQRAKAASRTLKQLDTETKNALLLAVADAIDACSEAILEANAQDVADGRAAGLSEALLDRLNLEGRLESVTNDVRRVAELPDPVGEEFDQQALPNGLRVRKRRVRSEEHTSELQSRPHLVCRLLPEKKKERRLTP